MAPHMKTLSLIEAVEKLAQARVLILGDVMLDEYLSGDADRISPEAPVPVVRIESDRRLVGGAGNVARNIVSLGGAVHLVGVRGQDQEGEAVAACLDADSITHDLISLPGRRTTVKTRILARQQQILRIDREHTEPHTRKESAALLKKVAAQLAGRHALVLSDYGKGLVTENMMHGLSALLAEHPMPLLVDPKPQNCSLYQGATLLTPNTKEASEAVAMPIKSKENIVAAGKAIMHKTGSPCLVITLGSQGMAVFEKSGLVHHIPTVAQEVFDVTGAGDTVIAVLSMGLACGLELITASLIANYAAGIVVSEVGASVVTPNQIAEAIATLPVPTIETWL